MSKHATADVRNITLIGGPGTGKTTLAEAILFAAGVVKRMGSVADGTTVSDYADDEKEKQHSLQLSVLHANHLGRRFHILDAPGYPDFVGEAASGLAAGEVAALCLHAGQGLTFPGHKIWELAGKVGKARCIVVTHLDQAEIELPAYAAELSETLGVRCLPVVLARGSGAKLEGIAAVPLGDKAEGELLALRDALIEAVVEIDDEAMMRFLEEDKPPSEEEAYALLTRSMVAGELVPVFGMAATASKGVDEFLQFAKKAFPAPTDGPFFKDTEGNEVTPDGGGNTAFVFKVVIDPFVGKLGLLRVVSGELKNGTSLKLQRLGKNEKLAHLQAMQGKDHTDAECAVAGDIVAVAKVEELDTSDTLTDASDVTLAPMVVPKPMAARSIEPANHAEEIKLSTALRRVASEDPAFSYERSAATGELVVHGTSMMHIDTMLKRITERSGVEIKVSIPRVALKETVTGKSPGHHRHKKQSGGRGQFAEVFLEVEPAERGQGLVFVDATVGGSVPKQYIPAVEKGVVEVMGKGVIAGYPVEDVTVRLKDGKHHDVDSDEASFKKAGGRAFKDGFLKARPVLLEPVLDLQVAIPSRFMGAITSDLTGRRGQISGMEALGDVQVVAARVPQREVMTYPTVLHSLTSGEGSYSAEFHDYEVVPANVQQEIMAEYKPAADDD